MTDYERIESIIRYLEINRAEQPSLEALAEFAGLSRFHLHRLFVQWTGITPKSFLKCLNLNHARGLLLAGQSVLSTAIETGLSGPSRLHDLCVTLESATPGELKSGGLGWTVDAGFAATPFGDCLIAQNSRGVCHVSFVGEVSKDVGDEAIRADWPNVDIRWDDKSAGRLASSIFATPTMDRSVSSLKAIVRGSDFQVRVWRALLRIPPGALVSYSDVASAIGQPTATRAVATAVGKNHLAGIVPCHRVIRQTGAVGEYRWGSTRKLAMVAVESARLEEQTSSGPAEETH